MILAQGGASQAATASGGACFIRPQFSARRYISAHLGLLTFRGRPDQQSIAGRAGRTPARAAQKLQAASTSMAEVGTAWFPTRCVPTARGLARRGGDRHLVYLASKAGRQSSWWGSRATARQDKRQPADLISKPQHRIHAPRTGALCVISRTRAGTDDTEGFHADFDPAAAGPPISQEVLDSSVNPGFVAHKIRPG